MAEPQRDIQQQQQIDYQAILRLSEQHGKGMYTNSQSTALGWFTENADAAWNGITNNAYQGEDRLRALTSLTPFFLVTRGGVEIQRLYAELRGALDETTDLIQKVRGYLAASRLSGRIGGKEEERKHLATIANDLVTSIDDAELKIGAQLENINSGFHQGELKKS